ncbi:MAG: hypothetical protein APF84_15665 [Gracilibacter sp. BRH_c7a]|nr:MAG: hypothetical protein APF84_15665 [Gracilibacter sp. BRH_c7a]
MEYYEIIIQGHIDQRREDWFAGLKITQLPEGKSLLAGEVADQSALHGILNRIRDMGLQLLSVKRKN